jgi:hypothetical protein
MCLRLVSMCASVGACCYICLHVDKSTPRPAVSSLWRFALCVTVYFQVSVCLLYVCACVFKCLCICSMCVHVFSSVCVFALCVCMCFQVSVYLLYVCACVFKCLCICAMCVRVFSSVWALLQLTLVDPLIGNCDGGTGVIDATGEFSGCHSLHGAVVSTHLHP